MERYRPIIYAEREDRNREFKAIEVLEKTWARIVHNKKGELIGFINLYVHCTRAELLIDR